MSRLPITLCHLQLACFLGQFLLNHTRINPIASIPNPHSRDPNLSPSSPIPVARNLCRSPANCRAVGFCFYALLSWSPWALGEIPIVVQLIFLFFPLTLSDNWLYGPWNQVEIWLTRQVKERKDLCQCWKRTKQWAELGMEAKPEFTFLTGLQEPGFVWDVSLAPA